MSELIPSLNIESFTSEVQASIAMIESAHALLMSARERLQKVGIDEYKFNRALSNGSYETFAMINKSNWLEQSTKRLEAGAWNALLNGSGLRTFMDQEAREKWDKSLEKLDVPDFTEVNIRETFKSMYDCRGLLFRRGLVNLFESLNPRYAVNSVWKLGARSILHSVFDRPPRASLCHTAFDRLDDLIRVMCVLDGEPEPDHRVSSYQCARRAIEEGNAQYSNAYMTIRLCRGARTAHVRITRLDLLEKANRILAEEFGKVLPMEKTQKK